jgi:hypothetical protein
VTDSPLGPTTAPPAREVLGEESENSLLDLVDHLLNKGVVATGDLVLGLADVDLIYLRLSALLCAADRVLPPGRSAAGGRPHGTAPVEPAAGGPSPVTSPAEPAAARDPGDRTPPHGDALEPGDHAGSDRRGRARAADDDVHPLADEELETLRGELEERVGSGPPARWNADPENARRAVAKLVLALVDFLRQLMERQAIRRMDAGTLTVEEVERVGVALMRLEETLHEMAERFGIPPEELNLDLGPLGRLT